MHPFLSLFLAVLLPQDSPSLVIAFVEVSVVPMDVECVVDNQTVLIQDGLILAVGDTAEIEVPPGAQVIEGRGRTLLPGLCDMHVHFRHAEESALRDYLAAGITTVREMNGRERLLEWRRRIGAGELVGPDLYVACPTIGNWSSPGEGFPTPETREEARRCVERFFDDGYDWIKFYSFLSREAFLGIAEEARRLGMPFGGHIPIDVTLEEALEAGVRSIEHQIGYVEAAMTPEARELDGEDMRAVFHAGTLDDEQLDRAVAATARHDVWICPTIVYFDRVLPTSMVEAAWSQAALREEGARNRREIARRLHRAGVHLALGTDSDAGDDLAADVIHDEMQALRECGLTPYEVLRAATAEAAELLQRETEFGRIARGLRANLLLVEGNPLEGLACLRTPAVVMVGGRIVP